MINCADIEFMIAEGKEDLVDKHGALPRPASEGAAAVDLVSIERETVRIAPGKSHKFMLGFRMHIADPNIAGFILPRSGKGSSGLVLANTIGLIDSDYQGELSANALNRLDEDEIVVEPGDRIFQMVFMPVILANFVRVQSFASTTARGAGSYGSTGK